jgi:uncharacterized protein (DUF488 family)
MMKETTDKAMFVERLLPTAREKLVTIADDAPPYRHLPALGGLRRRTEGPMPSPNTLWRVAAFRNYADYAATDAFRTGLDELRALARDNCCAIMCAEAVWWRCHRRIIADYLLADGVPVAHIVGPNKIDPEAHARRAIAARRDAHISSGGGGRGGQSNRLTRLWLHAGYTTIGSA